MEKVMGLPVETDEEAVILALNADTPEEAVAEASGESATTA